MSCTRQNESDRPTMYPLCCVAIHERYQKSPVFAVLGENDLSGKIISEFSADKVHVDTMCLYQVGINLWRGSVQNNALCTRWKSRGVRNPMKISDIGFLKIKLNQPQNSKTENSGFRGSVFKKLTSAVWGRFFTLSHSQFFLQHDRINSQSIFLHAVSLHFLFWVTSADN